MGRHTMNITHMIDIDGEKTACGMPSPSIMSNELVTDDVSYITCAGCCVVLNSKPAPAPVPALDIRSESQMKLDDVDACINSGLEMLEQASSSFTTADAATPAIMAVAYMMQAVSGQLGRIADILEDSPRD